MDRPFHHLEVEEHDGVFCVRLRERRLDETAVDELAEELVSLVTEHDCRKLALSLGPEPLDCLYSVFLAKLVTLRRRVLEHGGVLTLCDVHPHTRRVFEACRL